MFFFLTKPFLDSPSYSSNEINGSCFDKLGPNGENKSISDILVCTVLGNIAILRLWHLP